MFVAVSLIGLVFEPRVNKGAETRHLYVYLVRIKPPAMLVLVVITKVYVQKGIMVQLWFNSRSKCFRDGVFFI